MRVLSYNIHKGFGGQDRRYRLDRIVQVIQESEADLVCLQEVDINVRRSRFDDQPAILAEKCAAVDSLYQLNVPAQNGGYGNLILSRFPFQASAHISLRLKRKKPRGAQVVKVTTPKGDLILVNWHLSLTNGQRIWQANHLLHNETFQQMADGLPVIIVGDTNDWLNQLEHHVFNRFEYQQITSPPGMFRSFPGWLPVNALDKAFYRGPLQIGTTHLLRNRLTRAASDHLPLAIDFELEDLPAAAK